MPSTNRKIIAVVGATGNQGGSVARTFLELSEWHVRCLTRNPLSKAAKALSALGAEVVQADMASESSLSDAFKDAHAIFLNTDFWETYKPGTDNPNGPSQGAAAMATEISHGKNAALAASKIPTLEKLVYSALFPMNKLSNGKYHHSNHWESKAAIVDFIHAELPGLASKASEIYLGAYNTNPLMAPRIDPATGKWAFITALRPENRMPIIDPKTSTGPFVRALIETEPAGTRLLAYDSYPTMAEVVAIWRKASGQDATVHTLTLQQIHETLNLPMEILDGIGFIDEFGYTGGEKLTEPDGLSMTVKTRSFEDWMMERDWKALLEAARAEEESVKSASN
jgi:hypothetical protein